MPSLLVAALSLASLAILLSPDTGTADTSAVPLCGDVSNDGKLTTTDALRALRSAVNIEFCELEVCDYNGDGNLTASDALSILRAAVGSMVVPNCPGGRPELVVAGTSVDLELLDTYDIESNGLVVSTLVSEAVLGPNANSTQVEFADTDSGQVLFVSDSEGNPLLVSYFSAAEIANGSVVISIESIARGLVMTTPLLVGYSPADRIAVLELATADNDFPTLVSNIQAALSATPYNLLEDSAYPEIYAGALGLVIDALGSVPLAASRLAARQAGVMAATPAPLVGTTDAPYFSDKAGGDILAANPTMLFYGLEIESKGTFLLAGKESLWELEFGWPPAGFSEPVLQTIALGDGSFDANLNKIGLGSDAAVLASAANLLRASCDLLDVLFWCPASHSYIKRYLERAPLPTQLATAALDAFDSQLNISTPDKLIAKVVEILTDESNWRDLTEVLYASASDKAQAIRFLKSTKSLLAAASKILVVYDAANVYLPFAWDLITKPRELEFCLNQSAGSLSSNCQQSPPVARIQQVSADPLSVGMNVQFDASQSSDAETPANQLQVRWDFDGNGTFETAWTTTKIANWSYTTLGFYTVVLEVRDPQSLVGSTVHNVSVETSNRRLSAGAFHSCARKSDGSVSCWGEDFEGQASPPSGSFSRVAAGGLHTCGLRPAGAVLCWGDPSDGITDAPSGAFVDITAGGGHTCGLRSNSTIACWGDDHFGQTNAPLGTFVQVAAKGPNTCGLRPNGTIVCWGDNSYGQHTTPSGSFVRVAGGPHACAIRSDGSVVCWGDNSYGKATAPTGQFREVCVGHEHSCGIRSNDTLSCWGNDFEGESSPPQGTFREIACGGYHNCGLRTDGSVECWGWNGSGQSSPPCDFPASQGSACSTQRFEETAFTIVDHETGLEWEKKNGADFNGNPDPINPHDVDNAYTWSSTGSSANGTAHTQFIASLNASCFAGHCDWRLPSLSELQGIFVQVPPCETDVCIVDPIFEPTGIFNHWSSTSATDPLRAWAIYAFDGKPYANYKTGHNLVRAVRTIP